MLHLFFLCLIAIAPQTKWQTYTDSKNKFTIKYPFFWEQNEINGAIIFLSPLEDGNDQFQENVTVILKDLSQQPMTLEEYTELSKKQAIDAFGDSSIISLKNITIAGQQAKELISRMDYQGHSLKLKQCWFIKGKTAYLFSYTAEPKAYDKYVGIADDMIKSFQFY